MKPIKITLWQCPSCRNMDSRKEIIQDCIKEHEKGCYVTPLEELPVIDSGSTPGNPPPAPLEHPDFDV